MVHNPLQLSSSIDILRRFSLIQSIILSTALILLSILIILPVSVGEGSGLIIIGLF